MLNYLRKLAPANSLNLQQLTHKLVTLIALITAQRDQSIHKLRLDKLSFKGNKATFYVDDLLKQSRPGTLGCKLELNAYPPDRRLCVVKYLKRYIELTSRLRGTEQSLFISHKKPHRNVTVQTISRWIRFTLREAGIDTRVYKAHSTRAAATSAASRNGVPITQILTTAGWASERTFRRFYNKPLQVKGQFARSVLNCPQES